MADEEVNDDEVKDDDEVKVIGKVILTCHLCCTSPSPLAWGAWGEDPHHLGPPCHPCSPHLPEEEGGDAGHDAAQEAAQDARLLQTLGQRGWKENHRDAFFPLSVSL